MIRPLSLFCFLLPCAALAAPPSASLASGLTAYVNAYYLAEAKLADFDAELDAAAGSGGNFLARSHHYREVIALHSLLDEQARELNDAYARIPNPSRELDAFSARLGGLDPAERLAAGDLLAELREEHPEISPLYHGLEEESRARFSAAASIRAHVAAARADSALAEKVRALADDLEFPEDAPSTMSIRPGTGPNGNISGANFPARTWALTFDDGPHQKYTPMIFENLQAFGKKASFMWLVQCLERNPSLPAKAKSLGFSTNDHSWTHENLSKASPSDLQREIVASADKDVAFYNAPPPFFRLPYGAGLSNTGVRQLIASKGMVHVFWNVDSLDWKDKNPASVLARVKKEMALEKRGVILFHDIHPQSVEASRLLLQYSATLDHTPAALRWVTLPQILDELNHQSFSLDPARNIR